MFNRDEKIMNDIIKPRDDLINRLHQEKVSLQQELSKQANLVNKTEKYQKERNSILADNKELHNQVNNIKAEYKEKEEEMEL